MPTSFFSIRDVGELDFNKLVSQLGGAWNPFSTRARYVNAILQSQDVFQRYEINTPLRIAHFIGQGVVETGSLTLTVENLNYSAPRLRQVWPSRFRTDEIARQYANQPEKLANYVYSNRLGNGAPETNDGWTYRGRGFFQLTGRENYRNFGRISGFDLENNPRELEDIKKSVEVAAAYFHALGLGAYADADNASAVSRGVNRGDPRSTELAHGEANRVLWTNKALDLVKDPQKLLARASNDPNLRMGATGERVRALQQDLTDLGYTVGTIDAVFGPATRRALINFQEERHLTVTGIADEATRAAIDTALAPIVVTAPPAQAPVTESTAAIDPTPPPAPVPEPAPIEAAPEAPVSATETHAEAPSEPVAPPTPAPEPAVEAAPVEQPRPAPEPPAADAAPPPSAENVAAPAEPAPPPQAPEAPQEQPAASAETTVSDGQPQQPPA